MDFFQVAGGISDLTGPVPTQCMIALAFINRDYQINNIEDWITQSQIFWDLFFEGERQYLQLSNSRIAYLT